MKRSNPESGIQTAIMGFLDRALPANYWPFHVNNTPRSAFHGHRLKQMGLRRGTADICIVTSSGTVCFLEVKTPKGMLANPKREGKLSASQKEFRDWCGENAVPFAVVRGIGDTEAALLDWNVPLKARAGA